MDRRVWTVGAGVLIVALVAAFAPRQEEDQEKPEKDPLLVKILELMKAQKGGLTLKEQLKKQIGENAGGGLTFEEMFPDEDIEALTSSIAELYRKHYTEEEIDQLLAFFKTPLGRLLGERQARIEEDSVKITQEWAMRLAMRAMTRPKKIEDRKTANEVQAIGNLRKLSMSQARFREGDMDNDNILDYATTLKELHDAGLIDEDLGSGKAGGYIFSLSGSTFDWLTAATPESETTGTRNFIICTDGVVRFSSSGKASCSSPAIQ
jgi:hypothetical protein